MLPNDIAIMNHARMWYARNVDRDTTAIPLFSSLPIPESAFLVLPALSRNHGSAIRCQYGFTPAR